MPENGKKVCMFVLNPCTYDSRVLKEATTLGQAGYDVRIIAIVSKDVPDLIEEKENFTIYRIQPRALLFYLKRAKRGIKRSLSELKHGIKRSFSELKRSIKRSLPELKRGIKRSFSELKLGIRRAIRALFPLKENPDKESRIIIFIKKIKVILYSFRFLWAGFAIVININKIQVLISRLLSVVWHLFSYLCKLAKERVKRILKRYHRISTYISYWIKAKKLAESFQADVYHAHDLNTLLPAYLAAKNTGVKAVYDSHELYTERNTLLKETPFTKWITRKAEAFLIRRVNAVITVNGSIASELSSLYNISVPFTVMNCPAYQLGTRNNLLREKLPLNGGPKIILYLGKITFNRGLEESITAMQKVNNGVLAIMGYGKAEYISSLEEKVSRLGVEEKVCFVPAVPPHEVVRYAASADIGIVSFQNSCKSYYYTSPNKLFESMMAGLPVAASDLPELRQVVEETNCGYLFNPADPDAIANVLNNMISDGKILEQMRHNALLHAHKYSWEEEGKKLLLIYAGLFENQ